MFDAKLSAAADRDRPTGLIRSSTTVLCGAPSANLALVLVTCVPAIPASAGQDGSPGPQSARTLIGLRAAKGQPGDLRPCSHVGNGRPAGAREDNGLKLARSNSCSIDQECSTGATTAR